MLSLIRPQYDKEFNNTFYDHYKNIYFEDFIINIRSLGGKFSDVLRLRNLFLNGKRTKYNSDDVKLGKKLCTKKQLKQYEEKLIAKSKEVEEDLTNNIMNEYELYLEKKGGKND